jgi:hypothetical protein
MELEDGDQSERTWKNFKKKISDNTSLFIKSRVSTYKSCIDRKREDFSKYDFRWHCLFETLS